MVPGSSWSGNLLEMQILKKRKKGNADSQAPPQSTKLEFLEVASSTTSDLTSAAHEGLTATDLETNEAAGGCVYNCFRLHCLIRWPLTTRGYLIKMEQS